MSKRSAARAAAFACAVLAGMVVPVPAFAGGPRTLVVDDDRAQCPRASYSSIGSAVAAARDGDTVRVCGGRYPEDVVVDKRVDLVAEAPAAPAVDCTAETVDPSAALAVIEAEVTGVLVTASDARVDGFVVTSAENGIFTVQEGSGYRVTRNVIMDGTPFGIETESNGDRTTLVEGNCVRGTTFGGIVSQDGRLRNAVIRANFTVRNVYGIGAGSDQPRSDIAIAGNTSRADEVGIALSGSVGSSITGNNIDATGAAGFGAGIGVGGGNVGLEVSRNTLTGRAPIYFSRAVLGDLGPVDQRINVGVLVARNLVHDNPSAGITTASLLPGELGNITRSLYYRNTTIDNLATGLFVGPGNDGNVLIGNTSNNNARGIFLNGAVGTVVLANTMTGNTDADARDALPGENTWIANRCVKEDNPGTLCALPAGPSPTSDVSSGTSSGASAGTAGRGSTAVVPRRPAVDQRGWPCLRVPVWDVDPIDGGAWVWITVVAPDAPAGTFCGS